MATIKLIGILTDVFPVETTPTFSKKVFWIKQPATERYPNHWALELHQGETGRLKGFEIGDVLECEVEIRGKKWRKNNGEEVILTSLKCVGIELKKKIDVEPGKFIPKEKPGRDTGHDKPAAPELPL